jgi:quercetin dioxygenase-like cupin family protein
MHSPSLTVGADEGEALWFNGALAVIKSPGSWSEEAFSLVEVTMPKGRATGLHTDPSDETFYLLDGELLFHIDGQDRRAGAGATIAIGRGVPHAFLAVSELARFLVLNTPGTHDRFFRAAGVPATARTVEGAPPPDFERTLAAAKEVGVELLGPPPFSQDAVRLRSG